MSTRIYRWLLALYPEDLRRDYGEEMVLVFADELRDADFRGAVRAWRRALGEFFHFALPACASSSAVRVPAISLAIFLCSTASVAVVDYRRAPNAHAFFHALAAILAMPLLLTPYISLLAVWACRGRKLTALGLSHREEHAPCSKSAI
jgi:hypothetical protein